MFDDFDIDEAIASSYDIQLEQDQWRTREGKILQIKGMQTGHIENCIRFLVGKQGCIHKIQEFKEEIARRQKAGGRVVIAKYAFEITEQDIIELARSKGVKIPSSGAGVYGANECRINSVFVKFDTQKPVTIKRGKLRKNVKSLSYVRKRIGQKGSGARR